MIKLLEYTILFLTKYDCIYWVIIVTFIFSIYYVFFRKRENINPYIFDSIPSTFTSLGITGTFLGIASSLIFFDVNNITDSIPMLLQGLKTAFYTSILGIILSLFFSKFIEYNQNKIDKKLKEDSGIQDQIYHFNNDQKNTNTDQSTLFMLQKEQNELLKDIKNELNNNNSTGSKEQLSKLTDQFKNISTELHNTSKSLENLYSNTENLFEGKEVKTNMKELTSSKKTSEGKFHRIIKNLLILGFIEKFTNVIILLKFLRFW